MKTRPVAQALNCISPPDIDRRQEALARMTSRQLKDMLRAAGIGIPKTKREMVERLAHEASVVTTITTEACVMLPERDARRFKRATR